VYIHELGHYLAARSVGVGVEQFSIGFGRKIKGWVDKRGTEWKVCVIPLGGYVKMYGDESIDSIPASRRDEAFLLKNVWARIWVVFAGPLANFLLAFVLLFGMMSYGEQRQGAKIGLVVEESAAEAAGILEGDRLISMNDTVSPFWDDLIVEIHESNAKPMTVVVEREDVSGMLNEITIVVQPRFKERENKFGEKVTIPFFGIGPDMSDRILVEHELREAVVLAAEKTYEYSTLILTGIKKMITGSVSAEKIGGPVLIAQMAGSAGEAGWYPLLFLMVIISVNLGVINLFPIPMLDGGHLVFYLIEAIKGSPVNEKAQEISYRVGMLMVASLMVFAISNDGRRLYKGWTKDAEAEIAQQAAPKKEVIEQKISEKEDK